MLAGEDNAAQTVSSATVVSSLRRTLSNRCASKLTFLLLNVVSPFCFQMSNRCASQRRQASWQLIWLHLNLATSIWLRVDSNLAASNLATC